MKPLELNIPNMLFLVVDLDCVLACALLKPGAISVLGHRWLLLQGRGLILMKSTGDNPAETFQGLWDGLSTSRRFAFGCGQCLSRSLEPQKIFGGAAVGA